MGISEFLQFCDLIYKSVLWTLGSTYYCYLSFLQKGLCGHGFKSSW